MTEKQQKSKLSRSKIGEIGESIACRYLEKNYSQKIIGRNYRKKWGEIDIITKKGKILCFVEVKTVSCETNKEFLQLFKKYNPEENVHIWKRKRLYRAIQSYILEKRYDNLEWRCDVVAVFLNLKDKTAKIRYTENIVL